MKTPHLLQAADIAHADALSGLEFRPLELFRFYAGHVVNQGLPHGFLHGDHAHSALDVGEGEVLAATAG